MEGRGFPRPSTKNADDLQFHWLFVLQPGQAKAEYRLMLVEISWLESFTRRILPSAQKDHE